MTHPDTLYDNTDPGMNRFLLGIFILFVGGLAYILVPNYFRAKSAGLYTQCQSNCKNIGTALKIYADNNKGSYPAKLQMLTPDYLKTIPTCSGYETKIELIRRKRPTYCDTYTVSDDFRAYTFYCGSKDHDTIGVQDNYPQYNSTDGFGLHQGSPRISKNSEK